MQAAFRCRQIDAIADETSTPSRDSNAVPDPVEDALITRIVDTVVPHGKEEKIGNIAAAISINQSNNEKV